MKKLFAVVALSLGLGLLATSANAAGSYVLSVVNSYNPFSSTGTAILSGPVPTAGSATVDALGNVSTLGIAHSFVNANSTYNYTNGVWAAVVGGTSITHTETCTESMGTPCTGAVSGLNGIWNSTLQSGGAASGACGASAFFLAGNCDRVSITEVPGVSLTIVEQSEFAIPGLTSGFIYRFVGVPVPTCADFAAQVNSGSSNNSIEAASRCTNFAAAVTLSIPTQPANGVASINGANIVYTPNGGFVGTDTVSYEGAEGSDTDGGILTVTVVDATPDSFVFNDQPNVARSSQVISNTITVAGIAVDVEISISSLVTAEYSINGGAFTQAAGPISNGDTVTVRFTSSPAFSTPTDATLTIGGVSDTFTATTLAAPPPPPPAGNLPLPGGRGSLDGISLLALGLLGLLRRRKIPA